MAFPTKRTLTKSKVSVSENFVRTIRDETDEELAARQQLHNKYIDTYAEEKIFVLDSTVDTKHSSLDWTQVADSEKPLTDASAAEFKKYREDIKKIRDTLVNGDNEPLDKNDNFWDPDFSDMFSLFPTEPTPEYKPEE
jgi:hypothetical protein